MSSPRHIAPPGVILRGFDRWLCGAQAFVGDDFATEQLEPTCPVCIEAWKLQCEAQDADERSNHVEC